MTASRDALEALAASGHLKHEPWDAEEGARLLKVAQDSLADAAIDAMSMDGRFSRAYRAAHAAALAALRWHGYRSPNRYLVFQTLQHTVGWAPADWRVLDAHHRVRNRIEYEGFTLASERSLAELVRYAERLVRDVRSIVG